MATYNCFQEQNKKGKIGEAAVKNYFTQKYWKVADLSNIKEYQDQDTDFFIIGTENEQRAIEVKTDYRAIETGNLFAETISNEQYNTKGWVRKTKAEYLFYCVVGSGLCYIFKMDDIRNEVKNGNHYERRFWDSQDNKHHWGCLLPINELIDKYDCQIIALAELRG